LSTAIFTLKQQIPQQSHKLWKKFKLFSKNPLKNVKKYNIMVAIIGSFVKSATGKRELHENSEGFTPH